MSVKTKIIICMILAVLLMFILLFPEIWNFFKTQTVKSATVDTRIWYDFMLGQKTVLISLPPTLISLKTDRELVQIDLSVSPSITGKGIIVVALRDFEKLFAAKITWDNCTRTITVAIPSGIIATKLLTFIVSADSSKIVCDNKISGLYAPVFIQNGKSFVPIQIFKVMGAQIDYISETGGFRVSWDLN